MLTQPFIENAIEHGFRGSDKTGIIKISFSIRHENLEVEVVDNGVGINNSNQNTDQHKKHKSMAMQITGERLAALNRNRKHKVTFLVTDSRDETNLNTGTRVFFSIPL